MGGEGSGRKQNPVNVYTPERTNVSSINNVPFELPNLSQVKEGDRIIQRQNVSGAGWVFNDAQGVLILGGTPPGGAGAETDPIFVANSGAFLLTNQSGGLAYVLLAQSGSLAYVTLAQSGGLSYVTLAQSGGLSYVTLAQSGGLSYVTLAQSGSLSAYPINAIFNTLSGAYQTTSGAFNTLSGAHASLSGAVNLVNAKGKLMTYSGALFGLTVGANNLVLTADSAEGAGMKWSGATAGGITAAAEANNTPITDTAEDSTLNSVKRGVYFTLPTSEKFYLITGIEWKNGTVVAGNVICGVSTTDANPATLASTSILALGNEIAQSGTSAVQRNSQISSCIIKGGTICYGWININNASATLRYLGAQPSININKTVTYAVDEPTRENVAWVASTARIYIKVYYVGYS